MTKNDEERETVPLDDLRDDVASRRGDGESEASREAAGSEESGPDATDDGEIGSADDETPLSNLREDIAARDSQADEEHFLQESVADVESEAVWAELLMAEGDASGLLDPTAVEEADGRTYQVVPRSLCHRCEFFGEPPELHCTHDGTTIHETVDMEHYRVSECPMVAQDPTARE